MTSAFRKAALRFLCALPLLLILPLLLFLVALVLAGADLLWLISGRRFRSTSTLPAAQAASLVVPNWNGIDLLERFLPSWVAAIANHPGSEVIVVDNGSSDGSADWIRRNHPEVRVIALPTNLGFGGGSNAGFREARNDVVVLLNSDMRVEQDFLAPLLAGFTDENVFAVSCQIFLGDRTKRREETGLTEGRWEKGRLRVGHREDDAVADLFPCFYGGGGSCAFDRRKFLELGGFDETYAPFYLEDTDMGFMAWKRGWKVLYQPRSVVHHEHRGTIGKTRSKAYIDSVVRRNFVLFVWKNIHDWRYLAVSLLHMVASAFVTACSAPGSRSVQAGASASSILRSLLRLPVLLRSRVRARGLARVADREAFLRSRPGYFHDRFSSFPARPDQPRVLFVSPYPICPPIHGGGVFMYNTLRELSKRAEVHAIVLLDRENEREAQRELLRYCKTTECMVRPTGTRSGIGSLLPHAIDEFGSPDIEWLIDRQTLRHRVDVIQLEYTALGQYARNYKRLVCALFEHDVYFQSVGRAIPFIRNPFDRLKARFEYIRALRYELQLLPRCDEIQVCTSENKRYVEGFLPRLASRIDAGMRAGVDADSYAFPGGPRKPNTMLFLGSFRHIPNQVALNWFLREVMELILAEIPDARLVVAGSEPPPAHSLPGPVKSVDLLGFVADLTPLLSDCALFVCPVQSGSGVRVKLLEAFASGIPVVSTRIGAEGLAANDGEFCALADDPREFARNTVRLLRDAAAASEMAKRARTEVETNWDMAVITERLVERYRELTAAKRAAAAAIQSQLN